MNWVYLSPGILSKVEDDIPHVVKDVTEIVDEIHDVVFRVVSILEGNNVIEVSINILTSVPAIEGDWMHLLSNFGD